MADLTNGDMKALLDFAANRAKPEIVGLSGPNGEAAPLLVLSSGLTAQAAKPFFDAYRKAPERRRGTATLTDADSLVALVNRFKDADSAIFADRSETAPSVTAVLDYHRQGADASPRFGEHRAVFAFPLAPEWVRWSEVSGEEMDQAAFAAFIEDRVLDLSPPPTDQNDPVMPIARELGATFATPQQLVTLSRGLQVNQGVKFKQTLNLDSGEASFAFETEHADEFGKPLKVPNLFLITIPVFQSRPAYRVPVRLRYRAGGGAIHWKVELVRADVAFRDSFEETCQVIAQKTGLPLLFGAPERS